MEFTQNEICLEQSMCYEIFIRRSHNCKRYEYNANTDVWEDLNLKYFKYINANNKEEQDNLKKEYLQKLKEIKNYLDKAYQKIFYKTSDLDEKDLTSFKNYQILIIESNELNVIIKILKMSLDIMNNYKIFDIC